MHRIFLKPFVFKEQTTTTKDQENSAKRLAFKSKRRKTLSQKIRLNKKKQTNMEYV